MWAALGHGVLKSAAAGAGGSGGGSSGASAVDVGDWIVGHSRGAVFFPGPLRASARPEMIAWDWLDVGLRAPGLDCVRGVRVSVRHAGSSSGAAASTCTMHALHADAAGALYAVPLPLAGPEAEEADEGEDEAVLAVGEEGEGDGDGAWEAAEAEEVYEGLLPSVESPPSAVVRRAVAATASSSPVSPPAGRGARGRLALGTPGRGAKAAVGRGPAQPDLISLSVSGSRLI